MKIVEIHKNVISGQCYNAVARIQIRHSAIFIFVGLIPKGWQGLQIGFFAPAHSSKIGYRCIKFYASLLPALPGPVVSWPKWYRWVHRQMKTVRCLNREFI